MQSHELIEVDYDSKSSDHLFHVITGKTEVNIPGFSLQKAVIYRFKSVVRLEFLEEGGFKVYVWATSTSPEKCHARTKRISLSLQFPAENREQPHKERAAIMLAQLAKILDDATIEELERTIIECSDFKFQPDYSTITDLDLFFDRWGEPDQRVQFIHYDAIWRYYFICYSYRHDGSLRIHENSICITHGDAECPRNFFFDIPDLDKFFAFPWKVGYRDNRDREPLRSEFYTTDLDDIDVIEGARRNLSDLMDEIAENPSFGIAFINLTCLALIIGEDVDAIIKKFREKVNAPVIEVNALKLSPQGHITELLNHCAGVDDSPGGPVHVANLVGFPRNRGMDDVCEMLRNIGITINSSILPGIRLEDLEKYGDAGLQILHPGGAYADISAKIMAVFPMQTVTPEMPVGRQGTWDFLKMTAQAAGTMEQYDAFYEKQHAALDERWARVVEESSRYCLGFVVPHDKIPRLCDSFITWGIPVLKAVEEMGFGLRILIHAPRGRNVDATPFEKILREPNRCVIETFSDEKSLAILFEDGAFQSVYTDIFYDSRVTRRGKTCFSTSCFEPGFEGAFRTARYLQSLCRTTFYRDYAKYLVGGGKNK